MMVRSTASIRELLRRTPTKLHLAAGDEPHCEIRGLLDDVVEIRRCAPEMLVATTVEGAHDQALREGWRRLSRFVDESDPAARLRMLPTLIQGADEGSAPDGDAELDVDRIRAWAVAARVVSGAPGALPVEDDVDVRVVGVPERWVASLAYRSADNARAREEGRARLLAILSKHPAIHVMSSTYWVVLDGFARLESVTRNEAQVEIDPAGLPTRFKRPARPGPFPWSPSSPNARTS